MLRFFKNLFKSQRQLDEEYLSLATDHADLERRFRELDRRQVSAGAFGYKRV